jgi:hypothetical protein
VPSRSCADIQCRHNPAGSPTDAGATEHHDPPRITIAIVPRGTTVSQLARVPGMGVGLMSAGIGPVPAAQTHIDIGQGARLAPTLYDKPLPLLYVPIPANGGQERVPVPLWRQVRDRAESAPADLVPGLLGSTLQAAGVKRRAGVLPGSSAVVLADESGRITDRGGCARCPVVRIVAARAPQLAATARDLRARDLLVAIEEPPPIPNHELALGIAGAGFDGTLTSDSTRMRGYALSTDIAPTVLDRLGVAIPSAMDGEPIHDDGSVDASYVQSLEDRLAVIGPRRGPVIGANLLIWVGLCALAGIALGVRGLRAALPVLAVAVAYLPAVLLVTAALEPSETAERLIVAVGSPLLALTTLRLAPPLGALAIAGALSVIGYGVDVIAGSHLTGLSLVGPDPAEGVRFFGIGNELEAAIAALIPVVTGAALVTWAPRASARAAAMAFAGAAIVATAAFAPGRFGADVGAAIGIPIGAAVAIAAFLAGEGPAHPRARWVALVIAAPIVALAALVVADLVLGGNAHLTRSVLRAGGFDQLGDVLERRLRLSAHSFSRYARSPMLWLAVAAIAAGVIERRRIRAWFGRRRLAWAGLLGAVGATLAGTLANDSGALLLIIGALVCGTAVAVAWATHVPRM